ncbi:hypothetical protein Q8A67_009002 [Cirrhinus molitorella]|uniref:Uncharacterized protein n=1 Tax=Cirrhinus molitorella TaxID=172907 RepID=A0AA88PVI6_9TELE|nr:hypothetical protein Q8A67_009002 [Cirrhinus molitorella]
MKCAWAAESSRMKRSVQLGLLCLSLFVSSLHGDEAETEMSKELAPYFEEPDLHQPLMNRVRRQTVSTEENTAALPLSTQVYHRTKRQDKVRKKKPKNRPGSHSLLLRPPPWAPRVKRDT